MQLFTDLVPKVAKSIISVWTFFEEKLFYCRQLIVRWVNMLIMAASTVKLVYAQRVEVSVNKLCKVTGWMRIPAGNAQRKKAWRAISKWNSLRTSRCSKPDPASLLDLDTTKCWCGAYTSRRMWCYGTRLNAFLLSFNHRKAYIRCRCLGMKMPFLTEKKQQWDLLQCEMRETRNAWYKGDKRCRLCKIAVGWNQTVPHAPGVHGGPKSNPIPNHQIVLHCMTSTIVFWYLLFYICPPPNLPRILQCVSCGIVSVNDERPPQPSVSSI